MFGVGQSTILEDNVVRGTFVLRVGFMAVFIYWNDYFTGTNGEQCNISSKYPIIGVTLSMQNVKSVACQKRNPAMRTSIIWIPRGKKW